MGLVDYVLRYRRFETMLRTTASEQREDQRVMEGDPAARAQRRRAARSMRGDAPDLLAGAALLLTGPAGLTLIIAGGPPPSRVSIRTVAKGGAGSSCAGWPRPMVFLGSMMRPCRSAGAPSGLWFDDRCGADRRACRDLAGCLRCRGHSAAHASTTSWSVSCVSGRRSKSPQISYRAKPAARRSSSISGL